MVGLYRDATLETMPIEEVRSDLERLGVDPSASIALAKQLANDGVESVGTALLKQLEKAEVLDAEIADLEHAPLDSILSSLPDGMSLSPRDVTAALPDGDPAAVAKNAAPDGGSHDRKDALNKATSTNRSGPSDVTPADGIETDDQRDDEAVDKASAARFWQQVPAWGWRSSAIGLAACLVLFVAVRPFIIDQSGEVETTAVPTGSATPAVRATQPATKIEADLAAANQASIDRTEQTVIPDQREDRDRTQAVASVAEAVASVAEDRQALSSAVTSSPAAARAAQVESEARARDDEKLDPAEALERLSAQSRRTFSLAQTNADAVPPFDGSSVASRSFSLPEKVVGIFVIYANRVPDELNTLEEDDALSERLGEAILQARGRRVLALLAFERDGELIEAALVEAKPDAAAGDAERDARNEGVAPGALELLELSGEG